MCKPNKKNLPSINQKQKKNRDGSENQCYCERQQWRGGPANSHVLLLPREEVRRLHAEEIHYNSGYYWVDNWTRLSINGSLFTGSVDNFIPGTVWRSLVTMDIGWGGWWHIFLCRFRFYHWCFSSALLAKIKKSDHTPLPREEGATNCAGAVEDARGAGREVKVPCCASAVTPRGETHLSKQNRKISQSKQNKEDERKSHADARREEEAQTNKKTSHE